MPRVIWTGKDFSMKLVDPASGNNPCTRVLNLVMQADGALHKRRDFGAGTAPGDPDNHIVCELNGQSMIVAKFGTSIKYSTGGAFASIPMATGDAPIGLGNAHPTERGSFALHGNELYYSDSFTIFSWDGLNPGRRPGVVALKGKKYNGTGPELLPGGPFGHPDAFYETYLNVPPTTPPDPENGSINDPFVTKFDGEKTLNTGFCFSFYDPRRDTYGLRSEVFALPYIFGPPDPDGTTFILTDRRAQFSKTIKLPNVPADHPEYRIAVWFSVGLNILTNEKSIVLNGPFFALNEAAPAMSRRMTGTVFLEAIANSGPGTLACKKDNATLVQSARYLGVYERPVPSKFMAILPNGVAVYFYPWIKSPEDAGASGAQGNYAEYSAGHPEQIGRNTETRRDTKTYLPNLKGVPKAVVSDGDTQLLLTNHCVYGIGFDGQVRLNQIVDGRGLRAKPIANSATGTLWYSDDGVVWLRGGQMVLLDERLGFGDWFKSLTPTERRQVVIGAADTAKQILIFVAGPNGQRCICYDYQYDFVSEFDNFGGTATYSAMFRMDTDSKLWVFPLGQYPGTAPVSGTAYVEVFANDHTDKPKRITSVVVNLGPRDGTVTVEIEGVQQGDNESNAPFADNTVTETILATGNGSGRFHCHNAIDVHGRLFRVRVTAGSGEVSIQGIDVEYEFDAGTDGRSI